MTTTVKTVSATEFVEAIKNNKYASKQANVLVRENGVYLTPGAPKRFPTYKEFLTGTRGKGGEEFNFGVVQWKEGKRTLQRIVLLAFLKGDEKIEKGIFLRNENIPVEGGEIKKFISYDPYDFYVWINWEVEGISLHRKVDEKETNSLLDKMWEEVDLTPTPEKMEWELYEEYKGSYRLPPYKFLHEIAKAINRKEMETPDFKFDVSSGRFWDVSVRREIEDWEDDPNKVSRPILTKETIRVKLPDFTWEEMLKNPPTFMSKEEWGFVRKFSTLQGFVDLVTGDNIKKVKQKYKDLLKEYAKKVGGKYNLPVEDYKEE